MKLKKYLRDNMGIDAEEKINSLQKKELILKKGLETMYGVEMYAIYKTDTSLLWCEVWFVPSRNSSFQMGGAFPIEKKSLKNLSAGVYQKWYSAV